MQEEPLTLLRILGENTRVEFRYATTDGWGAAKYEVEEWCETNLSAPFRVMLAREDDISDEYAWLAIYCDPADVPKLVERWPRAAISEPRKRTEAEEAAARIVPDWLLKFAERSKNENSNR